MIQIKMNHFIGSNKQAMLLYQYFSEQLKSRATDLSEMRLIDFEHQDYNPTYMSLNAFTMNQLIEATLHISCRKYN